MSEASDVFNRLPPDVRAAAQGVMLEHQLRDLEIERDRAVRSHQKHLREIAAHRRNVEKSLQQWKRSPPPPNDE